ncbi:Uncharacterized protein GBIM_13760 [Gryllus bimaculatus]|nr:Uncharacterized protein GBIM_13760 [Gryllus bimaculatus]
MEGHKKARGRRGLAERAPQLQEMLARYSPWGRPGGGAPNPEVRKRKLHLQELFPDGDKGRTAIMAAPPPPPRQRSGHSGGGGGGSAGLRSDTQLHFQANEPGRRAVDVLRYRQAPQQQQAYRRELDALVDDRRRQREEEIRSCTERERLRIKEVVGKRGKAGRRGEKEGNGGERERAKRGAARPVRAVGAVNALQAVRCDAVGAAGGPAGSSGGHPSPHRPRSSTRWGGLTNRLYARYRLGDMTFEKDLTARGDRWLQRCAVPQAGVELVPLLARRRHPCRRPPPALQHRRHAPGAASPVVRVDWKAAAARSYTADLTQQVATKQQYLQRLRQEDVEGCRRHFATWQSLWGRPGHGAPRDDVLRRNLDHLLRQLPVT